MLEIEKVDLISRIEFNKIELDKTCIPREEDIRKQLKNDMDIKNISPEEQLI